MTFIRNSVKFFLPVLFPAFIFAQGNKSASELSMSVSASQKDTSEEQNLLRDRKNWKENISERTIHSSSYTTDDGRVIVHSSEVPLNYYDASGQLQNIDFNPKSFDDGWSANAQPYPTTLNIIGVAAVSLGNEKQFVFGENVKVNGNAVALSTPVMNGDVATISNIIPGMNKDFHFRLNGIKYNYVLNQQVPTVSGFLKISEELEIPQGYSFRKGERGREENGGWSGDYELISPSGEVASTIYAPICFDNANNYTIGTYKLRNENGHQYLDLLVPATWLNDISRAFPITIDPLITGPTAMWASGYMPSCITPAYNSDSILVTIPGQIAITGLIVTSSYYADPFTTAIMADGIMWFSTTCGQTTTFTIGPPAGNSPGTAYLDTFNLRSPMMCCFPQSCNTRTFYLRMHLSRTGPGSGCNSTYIRHDPITTLWPFEAFVVGHTVETYGIGFNVQTAPICSDVCTFNANVYVRYGVPPFTITNPWMMNNIVVGNPVGCSFGTTNQPMVLTLPNCPRYCDTVTVLPVPPPTITDACGNTAIAYQKYIHIIETPTLTASPNPDSLCSGQPISISLNACLPGSTIAWSGNNTSGSGNISDTIFNLTNTSTSTSYTATATSNGCASPPITVPVIVDPVIVAAFTYSQPCVAGLPILFTDNTQTSSGSIWAWDFGDAATSPLENPTHTFGSPGVYHVCFYVGNNHNCSDTICQDITVIPAEVVPPNVITPNGDGTNDLLVFSYLDYYKNNNLQVYDRWGKMIFEKDGYANDWNASKYTDGTYYYVLTLKDTGKTYHGFFQLMK
jgi:gliding motility-associated-like protein